MKERNAWTILGIILTVFSFLTFFASPETSVKIDISPLSMALYVLFFSGVSMAVTGFVGSLVNRL